MKKIFSKLLVLCLACSLFSNNVSAQDFSNNATKDVETILSNYHDNMLQLKSETSTFARTVTPSLASNMTKAVVSDLNENGYEAYEVSSQTYNEVEEKLATDFEELGLNKDESYIIVIEGEQEKSSRAAVVPPGAETEFEYTYNGTTYSMRYLTVTAADNSLMGKASSVNVLKSTYSSIIQNCLNTVISTYISTIDEVAGTVASLCGISMPDISSEGTATLYLNGGTNWTRIYTQVKSPSSGKWISGSYVERVQANSYMSGQYYDASSNQYEIVEPKISKRIEYSNNYSNHTWRKMYAVVGYSISSVQKNQVGNVKYKYGGTVKITHTETF